MQTRKIEVGKPAHDNAPFVQCREWTELRLDVPELMRLLGMPEGTRLISMRGDTINGVIVFTAEEPLEA